MRRFILYDSLITHSPHEWGSQNLDHARIQFGHIQPTYVGIETTCFGCTNERQFLQPTYVGIATLHKSARYFFTHPTFVGIAKSAHNLSVASPNTTHIRGDRKIDTLTDAYSSSIQPIHVGIHYADCSADGGTAPLLY